jgi:MFS family permease
VTDAPAHLPLAQAKRAALLLAMAAALAGSVGPAAIGLSGLVGLSLLPADRAGWATVPVTAFVVGSTLAAIPAALLMQRVGRRIGFIIGLFIGVVGCAAAGLAIIAGSFLAFTLTMAVTGASAAFGQQFRFAAADAAEPAFKARAISWVLAAGVISGVIGPQVAINAGWIVPGVPFAGPYFVVAALTLIAAGILTGLDVPPPAVRKDGKTGRPLPAIVFEPRFLIALLSAVASFSLMSFVMTATPLAMVGHHHSTADSQIAIQWHVIAMFLPSFVTGNLIGRFGKGVIATTGFVLIGAAALVALTGTGIPQFWTALILLGVGWNFGFIAATAMLTDLYRPEEAFKVQALNEFVLFGIVALASFSSGGVLAAAGWTLVNIIVLPVVIACIGLIAWRAMMERRTA